MVGPYDGSNDVRSAENELRANGIGLCLLLAALKLFRMAFIIRGTRWGRNGEKTEPGFRSSILQSPLCLGEEPPIT